MDWASSQWKEGLSSVAIQKINALEERIEKLQKERQQKQIQFECLELTLDKEKRKVEQEKQQTVHLERELQSLADTCKSLENKQQKLQAEIQNRDSRLNNLEGQLAQAKKQNCRLQQLENDIEDLRCLRENSKLEQRELEEKLKKEQTTVVKQSDAITDLEQTIKSLKEKSYSTEKSFSSDVDKENINTLNSNIEDKSESLKQKVLEQENMIKTLKEQLTNISAAKGKTAPSSDVFQTPVKTKNTPSETAVKNSYNFWDSFGSTPAKTGKLVVKHANDSTTFDDSDEKVHVLQLKLKQVCQELECQRHNSEAAKNAMEQKLKEKENALKGEIKHQAQTISDLDKELRELKNKYQQDVVQANKKLDVLNVQLQKSELSKQQTEKDLKALEVQMISKNTLLQQKDDELKDLNKMKNNFEATSKKLQSEKRELEQNNSALLAQKNKWNEEAKDLKIQLEGSNNLVKEKETMLQNSKKEHDGILKIKLELETKIKVLEQNLSRSNEENSNLSNKVQTCSDSVKLMQEAKENIEKEKNRLSDLLAAKSTELDSLKSEYSNLESRLCSVQSDNSVKTENITALNNEIKSLTEKYEAKVVDLNQMLSRTSEENCHLKSQVQTYSDSVKAMQENAKKLENENKNISDVLTTKSSELDSLKTECGNLVSELSSLRSENNAKMENIVVLNDEIKLLKEKHAANIVDLEQMLSKSKEDNSQLKNQMETCSDTVKAMQESMEQLEKENNRISVLLNTKTSELDSLKTECGNLESELFSLKSESNLKNENIAVLNDEIKSLKEKHESKVVDLEQKLSRSNEDNSQLKNEVLTYSDTIKSMKENVEKLENENCKISDLLTSKTSELDSSRIERDNLALELCSLKSENDSKSENIMVLNDEIKLLKEKHEKELAKLKEVMDRVNSEKAALEIELNSYEEKEKSFRDVLQKIEADKQNVSDLLAVEEKKCNTLDAELAELKGNMNSLEEKVKNKDKELADLKEVMDRVTSEKAAMETKLNSNEKKEKSFRDVLQKIEADKQNLSEILTAEQKKCCTLTAELTELKENMNNLMEEVKNKDKELTRINEIMDRVNSEKAALEAKLNSYDEKEKSFKDSLQKIEADKQNLSEILTAEQKKCNTLDGELTELKENMNNLKDNVKNKDNELSELKEVMDRVNSEKAAMEVKLNSSDEKEKSLKDVLQKIEEDKQNLSEILTAEQKKCSTLDAELTELKKNMNNLEDNVKNKDKELSELKEVMERVNSEKVAMETELNLYDRKEKSFKDVLQKTEADKQYLSELLTAEQEKCSTLDAQLSELRENMNNLEEEVKNKDKNIFQLAETINSIKMEKADIGTQLNEFSIKEESLKNDLLKSEAESLNFSELLNAEKKKCNMLDSELKQMKLNLESLENENMIKNEEISRLTENLNTVKMEKADIEVQLNEFNIKEESLKNDLLKSEAESLNFSELFNAEKKKCNVLDSEVKEINGNLASLENEMTIKNAKIEDLEQALSKSNEDIFQLKNEAQTYSDTLTAMQENMEKENSIISDLLATTTQELDSLKTEYDDLKSELCSLNSENNVKSESITALNEEVKSLKEKYENELSQLNETIEIIKMEKAGTETQLNEFITVEESLKTNLIKTEAQKQNLSELLSAEKEKYNLLDYETKEMKMNLESLKEESNIKDKRMLELQEDNDSLMCKLSTLRNDLKECFSKEVHLKKSLEETELKCQNLSKLEHMDNELKRSVDDHLIKLNFKEEHINSLELEMSKLIKNHEDEKNFLNAYIEDIKSCLISMQESVRIMSIENEVIQTEVSNMKREIQMTKNCDQQQLREELLNSLLGHLNSTEKHAEVLEENYENKITELMLCSESDKSKIHALQQKVEAVVLSKANLKQNLTEIELQNQTVPDLMSRENELKVDVSDILVELTLKNEKISSLESEINDLKDHNKMEKCIFDKCIKSIKNQFISLNECSRILHEKNDLIDDKIKMLKDEYAQSHQKDMNSNQVRVEFLLNLLNQLNSIEQHAESTFQKSEEEISLLKNKLCESELKVSIISCECNDIMDEKTNLLEKLKLFEKNLCEKELEQKSNVLIVNEQLVMIEDLKNVSKTLSHENNNLQEEICLLKNKLCEIESEISIKSCDYKNVIDEKASLLEKLKLYEENLCEKEEEQKKNVFVVNEQLIVIENLKTAIETLIHENDNLQELISDLRRSLTEVESKAVIQIEECNMLIDEKRNLMDEIKVNHEKLCEKELELRDAAIFKDMHINCVESIESLKNVNEKLNEEHNHLQLKVSSISQNLITAKEALNVVNSEINTILSNSMGVFQSVQVLQEQSAMISEELTDIKNDYGCLKNEVQSERSEIEDICQLVSSSMDVLKKYFIECQTLKIPTSVIEVVRDSSVVCCDEYNYQIPSKTQMLPTNAEKQLNNVSVEVYHVINSFQERIVSAKDRFKFLVHHHLLTPADTQKMLVALKFMKKIHKKISSKKFALELFQSCEWQFLFSKYQSCGDINTVINSLFKDENNEVNLFFEKCLLVNSFKNMYLASKLRKALDSIKLLVCDELPKFEEHLAFCKQYDNVNYHYSHFPIILKTDLLYLHHISNSLCSTRDSHEFLNQVRNRDMFDVKILDKIISSKVPLILNCLFKLHENDITTPDCPSVDKNLVCYVVKALVSSYKNECSFISYKSIKSLENLLCLVADNSSYILDKKQLECIQTSVFSLLQDLSHIPTYFSDKERELNRMNLFNQLSDEISHLRIEYNKKEEEISELHASLANERVKQQDLDVYLKETENNLSYTITENENWKKNISEVSKLCSILKNIFSDNCDILQLQSEFTTLSNTFCMCENCLTIGDKANNDVNHILFSPVNLIHCVAKLFTSKTDCEKEISNLKVSINDLRHEISELENEKVTLLQSINDLEGNVNTKEHALQSLQTKYAILENEYQNLNTLLLESNAVREDSQKSLERKCEELKKCRQEFQDLFSENQKLKDDILANEQKISLNKKNIQEKTFECELLNTKNKDYEAKIKDLNLTISKLSSNLNEANSKVTNLEKSINLLNTTLESVEEDLQNIYSEKKKVEETVQEKMDEIERLQQELVSWKNKMTGEESEISVLELTIKELKDTLQEEMNKCLDLQNINSKLQIENTCMRNVEKEHRVLLLQKNFCIEQKDSTIAKLNEEISSSNHEKSNLDVKIKELNNEIGKKASDLKDLKSKLNNAFKEKEELNEQLTALGEEKIKILQDLKEANIKYEKLISENELLKSESEYFTVEKSSFERKIETLCDKISTAEEELRKSVQLQNNVAFERDTLKYELHSLKNKIRVTAESNLQIQLEVDHLRERRQKLQQEVTELKKRISEDSQTAKRKIEELVLENGSLLNEINVLKTQLNTDSMCQINSKSQATDSNDYKEFLSEIIHLFIRIIKSIECSSDYENNKAELLSKLHDWENNFDSWKLYTNEVSTGLQSFLVHQTDKQKKFELNLYNITKSVFSHITELTRCYQSAGAEFKPSLDLSMLGDKSVLDSTLCGESFSVHDLNNLTKELQSSCEILESHFSSMKNTILKKELEIKSLQESMSKVKVQTDSTSSDMQNPEFQRLENKCKLLLSNSRRLEKKYQKLIETSGEMEARIKTLEKENHELEGEAEEMAQMLKQKASSDELVEAYKMLADSNKQLKLLQKENESLKSSLKQCEKLYIEQSQNLSKLMESSQNHG